MSEEIVAKVVRESDSCWCEHDLVVGGEYIVEGISMGQSFTYVYINGKSYNSVIFDFYENGKEIDIYSDPRFNLYL